MLVESNHRWKSFSSCNKQLRVYATTARLFLESNIRWELAQAGIRLEILEDRPEADPYRTSLSVKRSQSREAHTYKKQSNEGGNNLCGEPEGRNLRTAFS